MIVYDFNTYALAIVFVRVVLGILFFFQAYDKIFVAGLKEFTRNVTKGTQRSGLPLVFVRFSTHLSSYIELIGAVFLVSGLFLPWVYLFMAINLIMVVLGFSYLQPLWDMKHVFPRLAMLVFLMCTPQEMDVYSLSNFF